MIFKLKGKLRILVIENEPSKIIQIIISPNEQNFTKLLSSQSQILLIITYQDQYPEVIPKILVEKVAPSSPINTNSLQNKLENQANQSIGMPMVFTLAQFAKDWLDEECERIENGGEENEEIIEVEEKRITNIKINQNNEIKRNSNLTPVTVETFTKWWSNFSEKLLLLEIQEKTQEDLRPTGKQLFEQGDRKSVV